MPDNQLTWANKARCCWKGRAFVLFVFLPVTRMSSSQDKLSNSRVFVYDIPVVEHHIFQPCFGKRPGCCVRDDWWRRAVIEVASPFLHRRAVSGLTAVLITLELRVQVYHRVHSSIIEIIIINSPLFFTKWWQLCLLFTVIKFLLYFIFHFLFLF